MDIQLIHNYLNFLFRKERTGFIPHEDIDQVLDRMQMQAFSEYFEMYGLTQRLNDALQPFRTSVDYDTSNGVVALPSNYVHLIRADAATFNNAYQKAERRPIYFPQSDEFNKALNSQLRPVSLKRPIAEIKGNKIEVYPKGILAGTIHYLRRPLTPKFAYSVANRVVTYLPNTSVQLEFSDIYIDKIIAKALPYLGINLTDMTITQFGEMKDKIIQ